MTQQEKKHAEETERMPLRKPRELSNKVKHTAIDAGFTQQDLVARALRAYAKGGHN